MEEMSKSWEQKLAEQDSKNAEETKKKEAIELAKKSGNPQILNLNEDGVLDRKIFLDLMEHTTCKVGRKTANPDENPEVMLGGIGIQSDHAIFSTSGDRTKLWACNAEAAKHIYINGNALTNCHPVDLKPNDRIIFGTGTVFLYRCQQRDAEVELTDSPENPITFEYAMKEKQKNEDAADEERRAREKEVQDAENAAKMDALRV